MSAKRPFGLVDGILLLVVLGVAAAARIGYLAKAAEWGQTAGPIQVQDSLQREDGTNRDGQSRPDDQGGLVHNLTEHGWFGSRAPFAESEERTAHLSPGYPWLLTWVHYVVGPDKLEPTVRWIQCVLGILTAGIYFVFARRAFESRLVALLAGLLTGLHPFWVVNTAAINDGTVVAFLLALLLWFGTAAGQSGSAFISLLYGLFAAGLALMRAALLPFSFVAVLWLLWRSRRLERGWVCALCVFLGFINGLLPWTVRNLRTFKEPVPIVSSTYYHLWMGNNPQATGALRTEQQLIDALAVSRGVPAGLVRADLAEMNQTQRYRYLSTYVVREVSDRPTETLYRRFAATCYFFFSESLPNQQGVAQFSGTEGQWVRGWVESALYVMMGLMLGLSFLAWRWTYPWRERATTMTLALLWIPLPYILGHAAHLHGPRLPLDGVFLTYTAFVLACLWPGTARLLCKGPTTEPEAKPKS